MGDERGMRHGPPGPHPPRPALELSGQTLYLLRGPSVVAIDITDGSVVGQATLPPPPAREG
jgi:hypothetical protein